MFFRRKKKTEPLLEDPGTAPVTDLAPADGEGLGSAAGDVSTLFLTGDQTSDRSRVEVLLGAIASVTESRDLEPLLVDIVDRSVEVTGAERGLLLMTNSDGVLEVRVARGRGAIDIRSTDSDELRFSTSIAKRVLASSEALRATVSSDSEALELGRSVFDLKLRAAMCVPLAAGREEAHPGAPPIGVLYVDSRAATRRFSSSDLSFFAALAQHISISLENARLHLDSLEKVKLEASLELASAIQRDLMPELPESSRGYQLGGFFRPAERAGGDFYDVVPLKKNRLAFVVGDVSGHGIGPALITASAQAGLRSYLRMVEDLGQVVTLLNQDLSERIDDGRFLTLLLGILEEDGCLELVNGGHADPMIWRAATGEVDTFSGGGPALGMIDDFDYEVSGKGKLEPGDVLVVFSDGFSEARDPSDHSRMLGEDGVASELKAAAGEGLGAREITARLVKVALDICRDLREDDMTLIVLRNPS
ncbi:MAG: sigma-B regulation protein RsbU (phosphoserine phosphatase) [Bacteroidia bacterium]|jgi:serine phosphatase RsbU (regulator of sigma subunit)